MENLNFKPKDGWFATDPLNGGDNGIVAFQLTFAEKGARVIVETCVDESLGWNPVDAKVSHDASHGDVINGVLEGLNVRIRTNYMPTQAKITNL